MATWGSSVVDSAGVDTWSLCWYLGEGSPAHRAVEALATDPAPRSRMVPEAVANHRVGFFAGSRLLFAEGHPCEDGLAGPAEMHAAFDAVVTGLADRGVGVPLRDSRLVGGPAAADRVSGEGFAGVRRLDSTVDLRFDDPLDGLAALAGVASLPLARMKTETIREVGGSRVETVYFLGTSGKRVLGRWYDKGVESGSAGRGLHIRPEDQRRFPKQARLTLDAVTSGSYARTAFVRRFEPLWRASKGVRVGGVVEVAQRIGELVDEGVMSPAEAKAAASYLLLQKVGGCGQSQRQERRDRAAARRHGLVLADGVLDQVDVDLGEVLERALDSEAWGAQG